MDRRNFFANTIRLAAFSAFFGDAFTPEELLAAAQKPTDNAQDQFWNSFFDDVDPTKRHVVARDSSQPVPEHVEASKTPRYFHYDDDKGLRFAENIDRSELPKLHGAALVSVSISGFHASDADSKRIGDVTAAQLQLHAVQTSPIAQYIAPLAWASLASIFHDKSGKLPSVEQLNFTQQDGTSGASSSVSRVLFPKAEGKFAVNVTLPQRNSLLHKLITDSLKGAQIAAPLVSLPAISVPAIKAFTSFYNMLQANAGFIINSPLKDAVASYNAVDSGNMHADALKLLNGQYIVVPSASSDALSKQMSSLKLVNGYLVPKTLSQSEDPLVAAKNSVRDITYATLKVGVEQATSMVTAETPKGAPPNDAAPEDDTVKPKSKPKTPGKG